MWLRGSLDSDYLKSAFLMLRFLFFFFFFVQPTMVDRSSVTVFLCTVYRSHKLYFLSIFSLKMGPTVLFTHLKIILLQCFQFQQNKLYPNGPFVHTSFTVHMP